jgi:uncharacterized lipoprotein
MIVPELTGYRSDENKGNRWLSTLSQAQLSELRQINEEWWAQGYMGSADDQPEGQVMGDWIEENGGDREWWKYIELRETEEVKS